MPRKAPATGETSGAERYQSPGIGAAPRSPDGQHQIPRAADPCATLPGSPLRISRSAPRAACRTRSRLRARDPPSSATARPRGGRTPGPAAEPRHAASDRGSDCPSLPAPPGERRRACGATVTMWIRVSVLGSLSSASLSATLSAWVPGPIGAEGTESRTRARPTGRQAHPPCRDGVVARPDLDPERCPLAPRRARGSRAPARSSLPPSPAPGPTPR